VVVFAAPMPPFLDVLMTETQERFLRTVLTRVPLDTVVELHLFPSIRRGTLETGVAVIATMLPPAPLAMLDDAVLNGAESQAAAIDEAAPDTVIDTVVEDVAAAVEGQALADDVGDAIATADIAADAPPTFVATPPRLRILTAGYRHTIKGLERGKWVVDVQEEADAPLAAVEAVLRGVRQRSTEPADPALVSHDTLAALLTPAVVAPAA
jgi:hypothetical protein